MSPFARDLRALLTLWPLLWLLGVEQFAVPGFAAVETALMLGRRRGRLSVNTPTLLALLLTAWWLVPIQRVPVEDLDLFLKEFATAASLAALLLLFHNEIRTEADFKGVTDGLYRLALSLVGAMLLSWLPPFRQPFRSVLGFVVPEHLSRSSVFFESIVWRELVMSFPDGSVRLTSLTLNSSGLSMVVLLLIPLAAWIVYRRHGTRQALGLVALSGLLASLYLSGSRVAIAALVAGLSAFLLLTSRRLRWTALGLPLLPVLICLVELVGIGAALVADLPTALENVLILTRMSSWEARARVYEETLYLLPNYPISGWGLPVKIPDMLTVYSAGTHASHLGLLFQHGVVGLALYLALWISLFKRLARFLLRVVPAEVDRFFWVAIVAALVAFLTRSIADTWWWDQLTVLTLACFWGLASNLPVRAPRRETSPTTPEQ
jgi:hypothetical protein